jgi:hypothetical protein
VTGIGRQFGKKFSHHRGIERNAKNRRAQQCAASVAVTERRRAEAFSGEANNGSPSDSAARQREAERSPIPSWD